MSLLKNLSKEAVIRGVKIKNRIIMPAMGTGLADIEGQVTSEMINYYEERAIGGAGIIIVELACVDSPTGKASMTQINIDHPKYIAGLNDLSEAIKSHGSKAFIQLHHAGRQTTLAVTNGKPAVAPSPIPCKFMRTEPLELTIEEIQKIRKKFLSAAHYANKAGFDGVELHAAHGYLLSQFLSPYTNQRSDEYGGSTENRCRLVNEIIEDIRKSIPNLLISVRFNAADFVAGGIELEEGKEIAKIFEAAGADILNISAGIYESGLVSIEPASFTEGWRVYLSSAVKEKVNVAVTAGGVIRNPTHADKIIADGQADFIFVGRGMIADPHWADKAIYGKESEIRPCISCNTCISKNFNALHIRCAVNPIAGREWRLGKTKSSAEAKVLIIGAGPAGMQAAYHLANAGIKVEMIEKSGELGGLLNIAAKPPHKGKLDWINEYLKRQMKHPNISVHLNQEFSDAQTKDDDINFIIVATGAKPFIPEWSKEIPNDKILGLEYVLKNKTQLKEQKILVIGGGSSGCEIAEYFLAQKNEVSIIEQAKQLANGLESMTRIDLLTRLHTMGLKSKTHSEIIKIDNHFIEIKNKADNKSEKLEYDKVILACGYKPEEIQYNESKDKYNRIYLIGDVSKARGIEDAIYEGEMAGRNIIELLNRI